MNGKIGNMDIEFTMNLPAIFKKHEIPVGPAVTEMLRKRGFSSLEELQKEVELIKKKESKISSLSRKRAEALHMRLCHDILEVIKTYELERNEFKG